MIFSDEVERQLMRRKPKFLHKKKMELVFIEQLEQRAKYKKEWQVDPESLKVNFPNKPEEGKGIMQLLGNFFKVGWV
jgi:hypothetical protein